MAQRLKAAVWSGVLAASMATPAVDTAFASSPSLPDVSSALTGPAAPTRIEHGHDGRAIISRVKRHGRYVTITLRCTASRNRTCWTQVLVDKGSKQLSHKTFKFRGGTTKTITLRVPASAVRAGRSAVALSPTRCAPSRWATCST